MSPESRFITVNPWLLNSFRLDQWRIYSRIDLEEAKQVKFCVGFEVLTATVRKSALLATCFLGLFFYSED
jgi:hypothetical protein